jgi:predicted dehydrogenase
VEAVFVVTPTGAHAAPICAALDAGKHAITTKPMEASVAACDRMIDAADRSGKLLAVDFEFRLDPQVQRKKQQVESGRLGRILGGTMSLKIFRPQTYFDSRGGWRGTRALDGGGIMSNQSIHHIDELIYTLGVPRRVSMRTWTQTHRIEAEDLGTAVWEYADGSVVQLHGTTSYPFNGWYIHVEIWGTEGAVITSSSGPYGAPLEHWFLDGQWQPRLPESSPLKWANCAQNLAAAIRTGAPLVCDGRDGRRSRAVLEAMYASADGDGRWVDVTAPEVAAV